MEKCKIWIIMVLVAVLLSACGDQKSTGEADQTPSVSSGPTWQEQYDLGVRYLSEGNYQEAIIAFTAAIEIDPKQAPAYVGRGDAYVLSGETESNLAAAKLDYERAIELDETSAEAYLSLVDVYIRQGDAETARIILEQGLAATGDSRLQAQLDGLVELARQKNRPEGASETVTAVGRIVDNSDEYWDQWFPYVEQYRSASAICIYGIRFEAAINAQFGSDALSIQEAEAIAINLTELFDEDIELLIGHRIGLTGYFLPREEPGELTGPEYYETEENGYYIYHPNGDYYFYVENYTILD